MNEREAMEILGMVGALITNSHVVYSSMKHGTAYINKDAIYPHTADTSRLCRAIAERFADYKVEAVIAPATGGVILSQWIAHHLSEMNGREVLAVYADKYTTVNGFAIRRGYDKLIAGRRVLVAEDVLTTGNSAMKVVEATRAAGGRVVGLGVLCKRSGVIPQNVADVPTLSALVNMELDSWDEDACPLCKRNVPVNTDVGRGRLFIERQRNRKAMAERLRL